MTWIRHRSVGTSAEMRIVFATVVILVLSVMTVGQRIPIRSYDPTQFRLSDAELFLGTKTLPDGVETISYLEKYSPSRYYFIIEEEITPLEIVVTPCDCAITVKIFTQSLPPEGSANDSEDYDDDLFRQYNSLIRRPKIPEPLKTYTGSDVITYYEENAAVGIYVIEITTAEKYCSVRMSVSTSPFSHQIYPLLPRDSRVTTRYVGKGTVELLWKPSPSAWRLGQPINYCVAVNSQRHFATHCSVRSLVFNEPPPTAPSDVGFQFAWQRLNQNSPPETRDSVTSGELTYECVGDKTKFTFKKAVGNGHVFYFDVFAFNRKSNASATYTGSRIVTKTEEKMVRLKEGKLTHFQLKRSVPSRSYSFQLIKRSPELALRINPCSGILNVSVYLDHKDTPQIQTIWNKLISQLETFRLKDATSGQYIIRIVKEGSPRSSSFQMFISADPSSQDPYPVLPKDTRLKTFEKLNTCSSVTLAWMGTPRRQKYCLYVLPVSKQQHPSGLTSSSSSSIASFWEQDRCLTHRNRPRSEKVLCRQFRAVNDRRSVMTETVKKLRPRTTYVFTVYAVRQGGVSLSYEHLSVKTNDSC